MPGTPTSHYTIINIFASRTSEDILDLLFRRAHLSRTLFNIQAGEGSYLVGA